MLSVIMKPIMDDADVPIRTQTLSSGLKMQTIDTWYKCKLSGCSCMHHKVLGR